MEDSARMGLILGSVLAVPAALQLLVRGPGFFTGRSGVSWFIVILFYPVAGVLSCVILACTERFADGLLSRILVGFVTLSYRGGGVRHDGRVYHLVGLSSNS